MTIPAFHRSTLVAPRLKVLYTPTAKVACTTIKWMLAEAEGTLNLDVIPRLLPAIVHRSQTIHNRKVHGLTRLIDLPEREIVNILSSPEWIRMAALRDPVARSYSAWENRVFMRASGHVPDVERLSPDVLIDGRIDMTASFAAFAVALRDHTSSFMRDHHFIPQSTVVQPNIINYDMLVRVDEAGAIDRIASLLSERSGRRIEPQRHNESMGVPLQRACSRPSAGIIHHVYRSDYEVFGFAPTEFAESPEHFVLSESETQLVALVRQSIERVNSVSRAAQMKMSARYGLRQVRKALMRKVTFGRRYNTARELHW